MAVDAGQFLTNRELGIFVEGYDNMYSSVPMGYGLVQGPLSGTSTTNATEALMPMYGLGMEDSVFAKASVKSESGLSYAIPVSRKRPRESAINNQQFVSIPPPSFGDGDNHHLSDFSLHFQQQQSEIDRLIAQHMMIVRLEMEKKRRSYSRRIITAVEDVIVKKLRAKDEEIKKIAELNWALEEKVNSLYEENQIWKELAQTNEATANALRNNIQQVLAHVQEDEQRHHQNAAVEDAESCCGSNCVGVAGDNNYNNHSNTGGALDSGESTTKHGGRNGYGNINRMCRNCGKEEATVLIMPCRHLCLCYFCGPLLHNCPICNSVKNAMVHVNLVS